MYVQPTVEEYDITQLHENTYYDVCVKVFTAQLAVDDDYRQGTLHPATMAAAAWNNYDNAEMSLGDRSMFSQSDTGI